MLNVVYEDSFTKYVILLTVLILELKGIFYYSFNKFAKCVSFAHDPFSLKMVLQS